MTDVEAIAEESALISLEESSARDLEKERIYEGYGWNIEENVEKLRQYVLDKIKSGEGELPYGFQKKVFSHAMNVVGFPDYIRNLAIEMYGDELKEAGFSEICRLGHLAKRDRDRKGSVCC